MLQFIRHFTGSWISKILFVLLIVSFGIWGTGKVGTGVEQHVAKVGDITISPLELDRAFRNQLARMRKTLGPQFDAQQARQFGLVDVALNDLIQQAVIKQSVASFGLRVPDQLVAAEIAKMPVFNGRAGTFDADTMRQILAQNNLTEEQLLNDVRGDMGRRELLSAVANGASVSQTLARAMIRQRGEQRAAETLLITDASQPDPGQPDADTLAKFHTEHATAYTAPEYRDLTLVLLTAQTVAPTIEISDDDIKKSYDKRSAEFIKPEKRDLEQVLVDDQAKAEKIAELVGTGKTLADAAKAVQADMFPMTGVTKSDLPAELQDVAFQLAVGATSGPVHSGFGWHVVTVRKIEPGSEQTLAQVKDKVLADLRAEKATDLLFEESNKLDDALSGGASLEEAAKKVGAQLVTISKISAQGLDADGKPVPAIPPALLPKVIKSTFSLASGEATNMTEGVHNESFYAVRADTIVAPALRPLDSIRAQVVNDWRASQRAAAATARASKIVELLKAGGDPQKVAQEQGAVYGRTAAMPRNAKDPLPPDLVQQLFTAQPGGVVNGAVPGGQMVARLAQILPVPEDIMQKQLPVAEKSLRDMVASDLVDEMLAGLRQRYPVSENRTALARFQREE